MNLPQRGSRVLTQNDSFSGCASITFFFPSKVIGGSELLFVRLARFLTEERRVTVHVIDYVDGVLARSLEDSDVEVIDYVPGKKAQVPSGTCLVTSATHIYLLSRMLSLPPDTRLLFWCLHPYSLLTLLPKCNLLMKLTPVTLRYILKGLFFQERHAIWRTLRYAHSCSGLLFMDSENLRINQALFDLDLILPNFLPVPLGDEPAFCYEEGRNCRSPGNGLINLGWLGRLADHKVYTLDFVIREAHNYARMTGQRILFHVIGGGEYRSYLESRLPRDGLLEVHMAGTIVGKDLNRYLCENVDVLFAMGTSALEGARLRIPTVLLDACYTELPRNYLFRWLFESTGYDLGLIVSSSSVPQHRHSFADIIEGLKKDRNRLGELCREYYENNHSMTTVADRFVEFVNSSRLTFCDMEDGNYLHAGRIVQLWQSIRYKASKLKRTYRNVAVMSKS
jgi:hypothetical protein